MGTFFEHYFDFVFGLVMRLLGSRSTAEDVTQEVFYKVYRASHQLDTSRDPGPWLTAIAYNACRDVWRSGAYRLSRSSGSIDDDPGLASRLTSGTNDPERDALLGERERLVQRAISQLPEPLRTSIVLYDYQGLSHQQVADVMGIEHAAARKRYSRALSALAAALKESLG
jgi:RNA polymerase sigma-70 factor (ECF subfamily)